MNLKRWVVVGSVLGIAVLWAGAMLYPKTAELVPAEFLGEFVLFGYVPPKEGSQNSPYPPNETRHFEFFQSGQYLLRIMVSGGWEMRRQEGVVTMDENVLVMSQVSVDRVEERDGPWKYATRWDSDKSGRFLRLRSIDEGHELLLRKVTPQ